MSSGQAKWEEEKAEEAFALHCARMSNRGIPAITSVVAELSRVLNYLERDNLTLSRSGWARMDEMRRLLSRLD